MAIHVKQIMSDQPIRLGQNEAVAFAAEWMRQADVSAVLVENDGGELRGIVTDRDIAVRVVALGLDPYVLPLSSICDNTTTLSPEDDIHEVLEVMLRTGMCRIPVAQDGKAVGLLSLENLPFDVEEYMKLSRTGTA